jgi:hypothetical protein
VLAYGKAGRNSDPFIGEQVSALARQRADLTLNNPIGLYFAAFNPVDWQTPDNADPQSFWTIVRGAADHAVRGVFEVPGGAGYTVSDIRIAGRPIEFGGQIADFITIKLEGLATRLGQSNVLPVDGCYGEQPGAPPAMVAPIVLDHRLAVPPSAVAPTAAARRLVGADVEAVSMPDSLKRQLDLEVVEDAAPPALAPYPRLPDAYFATRQVSGRIFAYASPDSTYAVTRKLLDSAVRSIVIGIYDFSASYMKDELKRAMRRGVSISLMLDTNKDDDPNLFKELKQLGATCVQAPSSSAGHPAPCFANAMPANVADFAAGRAVISSVKDYYDV